MSQSGAYRLPMDPRIQKILTENDHQPIQNVADYIKRVSQYIRIGAKNISVYRGEPKKYSKPCTPNIYRDDLLKENRFFEKSLFDAMRQARLTGENRYLENAIDAQHGEFPSRLLDVTYNCLTALYFAVTPYYHKPEDAYDGEDGMVYVFHIDEMFSPSGENTNQYYNAIISHDPAWIDCPLFQKNHKFIDHVKMKDRIIAQQGAFILFQGNSLEELPRFCYSGMTIPGGSKPRIRQELKQLFGIHTGSIYPETVNLVGEMKEKSAHLNMKAFSMENELNYVLKQLEQELSYYLDYALDLHRNEETNMDLVMTDIEKIINSYRRGFMDLYYHSPKAEHFDHAALERAIAKYADVVRDFSQRVEQYGLGPFSGETLQKI